MFQIIAFIVILLSWAVTNILLFIAGNPNIDASIIFLAVVFIVYKVKFKLSVKEALILNGVKPIAWKELIKYVLIIGAISFVLSFSLTRIMNLDLAGFYNDHKENGPGALKIIDSYSKPIATFALLIFSIYGTFVEELIFRGLILRKLMAYNFILANFLQALLFGLLHLGIGFLGDVSVSLKIFLFLFPFVVGLIVGYVYKRSEKNLCVTWASHCTVNTITWIIFLFTGKII